MKRSLLLLVTALAAMGALFSASAQPYSDYAGTTIVVSWPALSHFEAAATLIPQFTEETGIEVELDLTQYLNMKDRQVTEISKPGSGDLDVVAWVVFHQKRVRGERLARAPGPLPQQPAPDDARL